MKRIRVLPRPPAAMAAVLALLFTSCADLDVPTEEGTGSEAKAQPWALSAGTTGASATSGGVAGVSALALQAQAAAAAAAANPVPACYGAAGLQPLAPWPMVGLCPMHRAQAPVVAAQTGAKPTGWSSGVVLSGAVRGSVAIAANGTIYTGTSARFTALNPNGSTKWSPTPGLAVDGSPAIGADGTVYMLTSGTSSQLKAISATNGSTKLNFAIGGTASSGPVLSADGATVYAGSQNGKLVAMNTASGIARWTLTTGAIWSSPALGSNGTLYVATDTGLRAVNPANGAVLWTRTFGTGGFVRTSPAIAADGTIYVGTDLKKLEATNPDGTARWSFTATGMGIVRSSPALAPDGTIVFGTQDKKVYAVKPDGTLKWSFTTLGNVDSSPAIGADGTVYVGSDDKSLYALRADGTKLFSVATGNFVRSAVAIGRDGTLYVGSDDQKLWAFGPGTCTSSDATCDGKDDNCSGAIDEGYLSQTSSCGVGACARAGATSCLSGGVVSDNCTPGTPATSDTTCNAVDENCSGLNDEGYAAQSTSCGVGACARSGATSCVSGAVQSNCTPGTPAASDATCNGLDDNCNGSADEGFVAASTSCGVGACARTGTSSCLNGSLQSSCVPGTPAASDGTCNGVDDNCNGSNDEGYPGQSSGCGMGTCARGGTISCVNGAVTNSCLPGIPAASDSTCNGVDENCNGSVDEECVFPAPPPGPNLVVNGTFDAGIAPNRGQKLSADGSTILAAPEIVSLETADTSNGSSGALRVTIARDSQSLYHSHNSGALVLLSALIPEAAGKWMQVSFRAKSVSGATLMTVTRLWGGGWEAARLTPQWRSYQLSIPLGYSTDALMFSLQQDSSGQVSNGVFLLDDIKVSELPNLVANGNFDTTIAPAYGQKLAADNTALTSPEVASRSTDTWNGEGGTLRLTLAKQPGYGYYDHTSGVVIPLSSVVPAGAWIQVGFIAKSLSGGTLVSAIKTWGGSTRAYIRIDPSGSSPVWRSYHGYLHTVQDISHLLINLVPNDNETIQTLDDGDLLLDEISVTIVSGPAPVTGCGPYGYELCEPSCAALNQCGEALLDRVSAAPIAAYSVADRLKSNYTGPALRVRRAANNAEMRIGFAGGNRLDEATLATFCGSSDCYLSALYDQSGNARHLEQSDAQIKVYDGATHTLTSSGSRPVLAIHDEAAGVHRDDSLGLVGNPNMTVAYVGRFVGPGPNSNELSPIRIGATEAGVVGDEVGLSYQPNMDYIYVGGGGLAWPAPNNTVMHSTVFSHSAGTLIGASTMRVAGSPATAFGASGPDDGFHLFGRRTLIGKHASNRSGAAAELRTVVAWNTVLGAADIATIEAGLAQGATPAACAGVQTCIAGDACCPSNCNSGNDSDCSTSGSACNASFGSVSTSCGVGACMRGGTISCVNGAVQNSCVPGTPAAGDTTCDGRDDNCNGSVDEGCLNQPPLASNNLVVNGTFETDIAPNYGNKMSLAGQAVVDPAMAVRETTDVGNASAGALRVSVVKDPQYQYYNHFAGAVIVLSPAVAVNTVIQVRFRAKSISGPTLLSIHRGGGGGSARARITTDWQSYERYIQLPYAASLLDFSLVAQDHPGVQPIENGVFLLDDIEVRAAPTQPSLTTGSYNDNCNGPAGVCSGQSQLLTGNLAVNGAFESDIAPTYGQKIVAPDGATLAPEMVSRETADTGNGSAGALRVSTAKASGFFYVGAYGGALVPLSSVMPANARLRVRFRAKSVSGSTWLGISRRGAQVAEAGRVSLTSAWASYEVWVRALANTGALSFGLVPNDANETQGLENGVFLVDDIDVREIATPNLIANGTFDTDLIPNSGQKLSSVGLVATAAPEMISRETSDVWNGTAGALRVNIAKDPQFVYESQRTGAVLPLSASVPGGTILQLRFNAKSLSGATTLSVASDQNGGNSFIQLTPNWDGYLATFQVANDTSQLYFGLVPRDSDDVQALADGAFLLDGVEAYAVETTNLIANGTFDADLAPHWGSKVDPVNGPFATPEIISRETADTSNGSAGALKVSVAKDPSFEYDSHNSGAGLLLEAYAPTRLPLQVSFRAKSISGGTLLNISRGGGGGYAHVVINGTWTYYSVTLKSDYPTWSLALNLVSRDDLNIQDLVDGVFLIDDLDVRPARPCVADGSCGVVGACANQHSCINGDFCCPAGCNPLADSDCTPPSGGNPPCVANTDTDHDGLLDCDEEHDGNPWTDPNVANPLCSTNDDCPTGRYCNADRLCSASSSLQNGTIQLKPSPVSLHAVHNNVNGSREPASADQDAGMWFEVPERLRVSFGNAANGTTNLLFTDAAGTQVTCIYRGLSSVAAPTRDLDRALGQFYHFVSCSNGAQPGRRVFGHHWNLDVLAGDAQFDGTEVQLDLGAGCDGMLDPPIWPEDTVRMREEFDWAATTALPTTDSTGLPALRYALIYVETPEQVDALKQMQVYFRTRPLFASELERYQGKCGTFERSGDNRGQFLFAFIPAELFNYFRQHAMTSTNQGQGPIEFRAIVLPPIPEPSLANADGTLSWHAMKDAGFQYFEDESQQQAPLFGIRIPFVDDVIDGIKNGNPLKIAGAILAPGVPIRVDTDTGIGGVVTGLFVPQDFAKSSIAEAVSIVRGTLSKGLALLGGIDNAVSGVVHLHLMLDVMNIDPAFPQNQPMRRAWGAPGLLAAKDAKVVPHGATAELIQRIIGVLPHSHTATIRSDGAFDIAAAKGTSGYNGGLCIRMENEAARFASDANTDEFCDFGNLDAVWDGFKHDVPDLSTPLLPGMTAAEIQVSDYRMNAFAQITDGYDYMDQIAGHKPRQAQISFGLAAQIFGTFQGDRPFTPCWAFPELKYEIQPLLTLLDGVPLLSLVTSGPDGLVGLPSLQRDMFLMSGSQAARESRSVVTHEYGHFVMCDGFHDGSENALLDLFKDRFATPEPKKRTDGNGVLMESFADFFASQVAGGVNYAVPQESTSWQSDMKYCDGNAVSTTRSPTCFEFNYRGIGDAVPGTDYEFADEVTRRLSTYHDAFDRKTDDWRSQPNLPTNGDPWKNSSPFPGASMVDSANGYLMDVDDNVALDGPALFEWLKTAATTACEVNGCRSTPVSFLGGLTRTMNTRPGITWCDECDLYVKHDPTFTPVGRTQQDIWAACATGELISLLGPPPDPALRMDASTCTPCRGNQISALNGVCLDCPIDEIVDRATNTCISCPADYVIDWQSANACFGAMVPISTSSPSTPDICPDVFVVEARGLLGLGSTTANAGDLLVSASGAALDPGPCAQATLQYRGHSELLTPAGALPPERISADSTGVSCQLQSCSDRCRYFGTVLAHIPSSTFNAADGYRISIEADRLATVATDLTFATSKPCFVQ